MIPVDEATLAEAICRAKPGRPALTLMNDEGGRQLSLDECRAELASRLSPRLAAKLMLPSV